MLPQTTHNRRLIWRSPSCSKYSTFWTIPKSISEDGTRTHTDLHPTDFKSVLATNYNTSPSKIFKYQFTSYIYIILNYSTFIKYISCRILHHSPAKRRACLGTFCPIPMYRTRLYPIVWECYIDYYNKFTPGRTRTYIAALSRRCLPGISRVFHH